MSTIADLERVERELRDDASPHLGDGWSLHRKRQADTIAAFIAAQGWRPIETAPCDGSTILLFCNTGGKHRSIHTGYFDCGEGGEGFRCDGDQCIPKNQKCFIGWMPLPEPPKESIDDWPRHIDGLEREPPKENQNG